MFRTEAPGQMMLAGEYTVVGRGGSCLAVAVGPGVNVSFEPDSDEFRVTAAELGLHEVEPARVPLVDHVLKALAGLMPGGHIQIQSSLGSGPTKPGLGASAAITLAVFAALRSAARMTPPTLSESVAMHQMAQGGLGSGYDAATSLLGGVIVFRNSNRRPEARCVSWPTGLYAAAISTGVGSSSRALLGKMSAWRAQNPRASHALEARMLTATNELVQTWTTGTPSDILGALANCQERLTAMNAEARMGLFDNRLGELLSVVEEAGAIGRVSGAGGGDSAWALSDDPERLARAIEAAEEAGFQHLPVDFPAEGLRNLSRQESLC